MDMHRIWMYGIQIRFFTLCNHLCILEGVWLLCGGDQGWRGLLWLISLVYCLKEGGTEGRSILDTCFGIPW